jgi:hypothetical protein
VDSSSQQFTSFYIYELKKKSLLFTPEIAKKQDQSKNHGAFDSRALCVCEMMKGLGMT